MKRVRKSMLSGAAAVGAVLAFTVAPASPASAALAKCTHAYLYDDSASSLLMNYVPATSTGSRNCQLSVNQTGGGVRGLQQTLNRCEGASLSVDGTFGPNTLAALKKAQHNNGISQTGVYDPTTRDHIAFFSQVQSTTVNCAATSANAGTWVTVRAQYSS